MQTLIGPIEVGELKLLKFNGSSEMEPGETIASVSRQIRLIAGDDTNPASHFVGAAAVSGQLVLQRFEATAAMRGNRYEVSMLITDGSGLVHRIDAELAVAVS